MSPDLGEKLITINAIDADCMIEGSECWEGRHYGPEAPRMKAPYIDEIEDVSDVVFTKKEIKAKKECPSCCIRCIATDDPNTWN